MIGPLAGLALGFGGSLHCVGMCGPIAIALPSSSRDNAVRSHGLDTQEVVQKSAYQIGRVTTYTLLGAVVGIGGSLFNLAGYGRALSISAGVLMILSALVQIVFQRELLPKALADRAVAPVQRTLRRLIKGHGTLSHFAIGLVNGLLPCGLVTTALLGAAGTGSILDGGLFMMMFGLGTVPLMSAVALGATRLSCKLRHSLRYAAPFVVAVMGVLFTMRGLGLGVAYLSPAPPTPAQHSCCSGVD